MTITHPDAVSACIRLQQEIESLQTLRDRIRVRLHLAGMEIRTTWERLEPEFRDLEAKIAARTETAERLVRIAVELVATYRSIDRTMRQ